MEIFEKSTDRHGQMMSVIFHPILIRMTYPLLFFLARSLLLYFVFFHDQFFSQVWLSSIHEMSSKMKERRKEKKKDSVHIG